MNRQLFWTIFKAAFAVILPTELKLDESVQKIKDPAKWKEITPDNCYYTGIEWGRSGTTQTVDNVE